jgi:hypothetical protein
MVPMALPSFGGMTIQILTMLIVPVLYCWVRELRLRRVPQPAEVAGQAVLPLPGPQTSEPPAE